MADDSGGAVRPNQAFRSQIGKGLTSHEITGAA
jgi:hypothetical protein